jgi:hypothetical protein
VDKVARQPRLASLAEAVAVLDARLLKVAVVGEAGARHDDDFGVRCHREVDTDAFVLGNLKDILHHIVGRGFVPVCSLVGSGALGVVVVVANLLSPHTSSRETNTTSHFTLQACYDAVPHLLDVRQNNGWDPDFFLLK